MDKTATHKTILLSIFSFFLLMVMPCATASANNDRQIDSLLNAIDKAIEQSDKYVLNKTKRIGQLKTQLAEAHNQSAAYDISYKLYQEYLPFVNDSAIFYLNNCANLARQMGNESLAGGCMALIALSCSNAGLYLDSESILKDIDHQQLHGTDLGLYYNACAHVAGEMEYYGNFTPTRRQYGKRAGEYRLLLMRYLPANHKYSRQCKETMAHANGNYNKALELNTQWLKSVRRGSTDYALVTFYRYLEYKALGDSIQMMRWLAESVLCDIKNAVMDQGSMWEMANLLMSAGDVDRSYRYICFTSDCADRFGSRQRLSRISPLLSRIAQSYKAKEEKSNHSLRITNTLISIMAVMLLLAITVLYRQRNRLVATRDQLATSNEQLKESNLQLSGLNSQLSELNSQLSEANRVKEEYVGRFMRLCSLYIDRLDELRKKVAKRVKNRQYTELGELTRSADFKTDETDVLYENFDTAFLNLFPSFVDEFNALLKPECRIFLPEAKSLNTVIRIFALIRLGITDSSKIAEFLHYSVNTIYNYRANTKNGALVDRAEFENCVKRIGIPKE